MATPTEGPRPAGRRWARTEETQRQLLAAARAVFIEKGYTAAGISDVVERSGSSVGSVYHHFGGKAEIYLALWEEYVGTLAHAAADVVAQTRESAPSSPMDQFEAGTVAYLEAVWRDRDLFPVFYNGDGPPGFEPMRRRRNAEWIRRNLQVLGLGRSVEDRVTAGVLTSLVGEAARVVVTRRSAREARRVAKHAVLLARSIYSGAMASKNQERED